MSTQLLPPELPKTPRLTIPGHLEELRRRLGLCLLTVALTSGASFWYGDRLLAWLKRPAGELLPRLAFFSPTEALVAYVKMALVCGVALALPVVLYHAWAFVRPGLSGDERRFSFAWIGWGSALFAMGVWCGYGLCLPLFLRFLLTVGGASLQPVISVSAYLSFVLGILGVCGALCELPIVLFVLIRLGILTPQMLRRQRGVALVSLVVVAAVVTPTTDAVSLMLVAVPLVALYELSIAFSGWFVRR